MICVVVFISTTILHRRICNIPSKSSHFSLSAHIKQFTANMEAAVSNGTDEGWFVGHCEWDQSCAG